MKSHKYHKSRNMTSDEIKCVVWDLDNTLWKGVLLEDSHVIINQHVVNAIKELDARGILNSIASRNDYDHAVSQLSEFALEDYFLYPQIGWGSKSESIRSIAESLNIGIDTIAFIDDQVFEREEVSFSIPEVTVADVVEIETLLASERFNPRVITDESRRRRQLYREDAERRQVEQNFQGTDKEFLSTLQMQMKISEAADGDLLRIAELTVRTNQLNATGYTYSYEELEYFRASENHLLLVASLSDKYGSYGIVGLALVELHSHTWRLKLLLMSCRVMNRGVGSAMLVSLLSLAKQRNVNIAAEFIETARNRIMYITYKLNGFKEVTRTHNETLLEHDMERIHPTPNYLDVDISLSI